MGGDRLSPLISSTSILSKLPLSQFLYILSIKLKGGVSLADEESSLEQESREYPFDLPTLLRGDGLSSEIEGGSVNADKDLVFGKFDDVGSQLSSNSLIFKGNQRRARCVYSEVLRSYNELQCRTENLDEAKRIILSYNAGAWTEKVGGMKISDYNVPSTTSLLLIGPERSGKSNLVNRISRVFDDDKFAPERAQVSYDPYVEDGTYFLHEYMITRGSTSFCLYDTQFV